MIQSAPTTSTSLFNPYPLLLSNRSKRPHELQSYIILFQHSNDLEIRFRAATPSITQKGTKKNQNDKKTKTIYEQAGLLNPREAAILDSTGFLWIQKTFYELCQQYDGKFIFIRAVGNLCFQDGNHNGIQQFYKNGQTIDLISDPLGWDSDIDSLDDLKTNQNKYHHPNTFTCQLDNLDAFATTISNAALSIMNQNSQNTPSPSSSNNSNSKSTNIPDTNFQIPILFDSLQPFLMAHGVHYTIALIQRLSSNHHRQHSPSSFPPLSPIILPVLTNSLHPSHHRLLEDASNAIVHLKEGTCNIVRKSHRGTGKITKEYQPFFITSELNMGFTLPCIQFQSRTNTNDDKKNETHNDQTTHTSSSNYNDISDVTFKLGQLTPQEEAMRNATILPHHKSRSMPPRNKIKIQMEKDDDYTNQKDETQKQNNGPKIYLEDDDPEFDDMDEEDPDDDLDL